MKSFVFTFFIFSTLLCYAQDEVRETQSRMEAEKIIENYLNEEVSNKDYLLFSIADKLYLIIVNNEKNKYTEIFFRNGVLVYQKNLKKKDELKKAFNPDNYLEKGSLYYDYSKVQLSNGNNTYFYLMTKDKIKHGESFSVTMIAPAPIDTDIYYYLLNRLLVLDNKIKNK